MDFSVEKKSIKCSNCSVSSKMNGLLYKLLCIDNFYEALDYTVQGMQQIFYVKGISTLEIINKKEIVCRKYDDLNSASSIERFEFSNNVILDKLKAKDYIFINCSQIHRIIIAFDFLENEKQAKTFENYIEIINKVISALYKKMLKEEYLTEKSFNDMLTGCYNRNYFEVKVNEYKNAVGIGVIVCDMDMLKFINDNLGHSFGDHIIKNFAKRLKNIISDDDFIFRVGGDEFIIITENKTHDYVKALASTIKVEFRMIEMSKKFPISVSVGYSYKQSRSQSIREAIKIADYFMYQSKLNHKNNSSRIISNYVYNLRE